MERTGRGQFRTPTAAKVQGIKYHIQMENMTKIIEEYSHIIRMMETENEELKNENESL